MPQEGQAVSDEPKQGGSRVKVVRSPRGKIEPTLSDLTLMAVIAPGYRGSRGLTMCFHSDPGTGKTSLMTKAIKQAGLHPYIIDMTRRAPEDVTGIPHPVKKDLAIKDASGEQMHNPDGTPTTVEVWFTIKTPDITWATIEADRKAVIIFDDATNIPPAVQAAMLDIVLDKRFSDGAGGFVSLKHAAMLMAANYGDGSSLTPFLGPIANRAGHVVATARDNRLYYEAVNAYDLERHPELLAEAEDPELTTIDVAKAATLEQGWNLRYAKKLGLIARWATENRNALTSPTPQDFPTPDDYAFATNRSYEFLARWLAVCEHFDVDTQRVTYGIIGKDKGRDFLEWMAVREQVAQALANTLDWKGLTPAQMGTVSKKAAGEATTREEVEGLIASFKRLEPAVGMSQDPFRPGRELLIARARADDSPFTETTRFVIRAAFEDAWNTSARAVGAEELTPEQRARVEFSENVSRALLGSIDWDQVPTDQHVQVAETAALAADTDSHVTGVLSSLRKLRRSEQPNIAAYARGRDAIIGRAVGTVDRALSDNGKFAVWKAWPRLVEDATKALSAAPVQPPASPGDGEQIAGVA